MYRLRKIAIQTKAQEIVREITEVKSGIGFIDDLVKKWAKEFIAMPDQRERLWNQILTTMEVLDESMYEGAADMSYTPYGSEESW